MTSEGKNSAACLWQGAGLWYLGFCLAGLAAGLWPDAILPSKSGPRPLPLPTLQTLAVAQAAFFLLVYPLAILRRREINKINRDGPHLFLNKWGPSLFISETVVLLIVSAPFYYVAAYLADATATDVARAAIGVACLIPLSWAGAAWLCRGGAWRTLGGLLLLTASLALPAITYITTETLSPALADWLWQLSPATYLWQNCDSRLVSILPRPLWPGVSYLATAAVMFLLTLFVNPQRRQTTN
jgi:hypothetical protein